LFRHVFKYSNSKIIIYSNLTYVSKFIIVALVLLLFYSVGRFHLILIKNSLRIKIR
jgi:hypothetical protein